MIKLVLIRHGESSWNKLNKFTGWTDVGLSAKGKEEAKLAGQKLKQNGYTFDLAYTSFLKRAIKTLEIIKKEMGVKIPTKKSWRLNEKHYGALQGLNKEQTAKKYGEDKVKEWRRSYDVQPPTLEENDERNPAKQELYKDVPKKDLPLTESLKDTVNRFIPYWKEEIVPELLHGKKIIISAHGNSLRALVKYLDNISDSEINNLNIPTGIPLVYELDNNLKPIKKYYLASDEEVKAAIESVKAQGKIKK